MSAEQPEKGAEEKEKILLEKWQSFLSMIKYSKSNEDPDIWESAGNFEREFWCCLNRVDSFGIDILNEISKLSKDKLSFFYDLISIYSLNVDIKFLQEKIQGNLEKNIKSLEILEKGKKIIEEQIELIMSATNYKKGDVSANKDEKNTTNIQIIIQGALYLTIQDLICLSKTNKELANLVKSVSIPSSPSTKIPFKMLMDELAGFLLSGLHGASNYDALSLYRGVQLKSEENNFKGRSQLGDGFYLTDGIGEDSQNAADSYATNRVGNLRARGMSDSLKAQIFQVFTKKLSILRENYISRENFWNLKNSSISADVYKSSIDAPGQNHGSQIKINPHVLQSGEKDFDIRIAPQFKEGQVSDLSYLGYLLEKHTSSTPKDGFFHHSKTMDASAAASNDTTDKSLDDEKEPEKENCDKIVKLT